MACCKILLFIAAATAYVNFVSTRAVNISNTWILPEEGFPVFYRYFRDRISWYEADAVCQFHHANLVTADTSSQYDAIRAYLKELDIAENVWIGLSKTAEKPNFTWTDFRPLTGEGHWQVALPAGDDAMCAVTDPAADFLWRPLPCGGPEVAAFICELPIPSWALGPKGCLLTELPSLTVLYIPEQSAVELTSDCGLDGTKRIACKGQADREQLLKQLTCVISNEDFDEKSTRSSNTDEMETSTDDGSKTTKTWTSNTIDGEYGMPTRHRRETEDTLSPISTRSTFEQDYTTTDLSWKRLQENKITTEASSTVSVANYDTEVTTVNTKSDTTLDASVSKLTSSPEATLDPENRKFASADGVETADAGSVLTAKPDTKMDAIVATSRSTTETTEKAATDSNETQKNMDVTTLDFKDTPYRRDTGSTTEKTIVPVEEKKHTESFVTVSNPTAEAAELDNDEYPSAINQGQLFSIIENGTMFDIIELNDTTAYSPEVKSTKAVPTSSSVLTNDALDLITKKPTKKILKPTKIEIKEKSKIQATKMPYYKEDKTQINVTTPTNENLNKEFEMLPIVKDFSVKLNRTFRKELPQLHDEHDILESGSQFGIPKVINFSITNNLNPEDGKNEDEILSEMLTPLPLKETNEELDVNIMFVPGNIETINDETKIIEDMSKVIDPKIEILNQNVSKINNDTEMVQPMNTVNKDELKKQLLPKSLLPGTTESVSPEEILPTSEKPFSPDYDDDQQRPKRKRQLTRPQKKSFYPYFFSRMLG